MIFQQEGRHLEPELAPNDIVRWMLLDTNRVANATLESAVKAGNQGQAAESASVVAFITSLLGENTDPENDLVAIQIPTPLVEIDPEDFTHTTAPQRANYVVFRKKILSILQTNPQKKDLCERLFSEPEVVQLDHDDYVYITTLFGESRSGELSYFARQETADRWIHSLAGISYEPNSVEFRTIFIASSNPQP